MSDTPETDAFTTSFTSIDDLKGKKQWVPSDFARKLKRERDEAREKIKRQASRICELEGATNHAGGIKKDLQENLVFGTPETDAMVERWQNSHIPADFSRRMETERNEARRLADTRLTQLLAITSSEPKDYLGLVVACRVHKDHIAQLIKERDEGREEWGGASIDAAQLLSEKTKIIAECDEMKDALKDMLSGWKYIRQVYGDLSGVGWDRAQTKAENVLLK